VAVTVVDRIVGQFATCSFNTGIAVYTQLVSCTEWEVTIESEMADVTVTAAI